MQFGYIRLYRKTIDSAIFADPELFKLWILCLLKATHKERWGTVDGMKEPIKLLPGQFITGRFALHRDYYPKRKKNQKSPLTVWNWLRILENLGNLNIKSNNKFSIITIINWDSYQGWSNKNEQQNEQQTISRLSADYQQTITYNNVLNVLNDFKRDIDLLPDSKNPPKKQTPKPKKKFVPPTEKEVVSYFTDNGYPPELGSKAFKYYEAGGWKDSTGKPVKAWKQKMQGVWFRPENLPKQEPERYQALN